VAIDNKECYWSPYNISLWSRQRLLTFRSKQLYKIFLKELDGGKQLYKIFLKELDGVHKAE